MAATIYILVNKSPTLMQTVDVESAVLAAGGTARYTGSAVAGENYFSITGDFTPSTNYYLHAVAKAAGVLSNVDVVASYLQPVAVVSPTIRGSSKVGARDSQTQVITVPDGTVTGDWMTLKFFMPASKTPVAPTGWTFVTKEIENGGNNAGIFLYKRQASSEPASYTVDAGSNSSWSVEITSYAGASGIGATVGKSRTPFGASLDTAPIVASNGSLIESICASDQDTLAAPGALALLKQVTSATAYIGFADAYEASVAAGPTNPQTFTSAAGSSLAAMTIEVLA